MSEINEFGEIIREKNEVTNMQEKISLEELKSKIIKYIELDNYGQATFEKENLVNNMKDEYIAYLLNEIGIRNESILRYAVDNFEQISLDIQQMLKERSDRHIDTKIQIIQNEYINNEEEKENVQRNLNAANEGIEETQTQIDYEDKVKQIIADNINDAINQVKRTLNNIGINVKKIEEISDALYEKRNELFKYSFKFDEMLTDLDKKITEFVQNINEEYVQEILNQENDINESKEKSSSASKFRDSLEVDNSKNQIEKKAVENIANSINNKKKEQLIDGLSPEEIFGEDKKQATYKSKFDGLDASDIF